ncbi:MAG: carbon-nitrogen hydrolase family protein [Anaerolineae bacterium]|nr:carbon-nitrogen hydrolase family protein [Anaerolineae bacterium]
MKSQATITMVQFQSNQAEDNVLERMHPFFVDAKTHNADMVVFPEYCLGSRISIAHPNVLGFLAMAREFRLYAVAGFVETHGTRWATTALMVDKNGVILGRYLKTHPASGPPPHWWPPLPGHDHEARGILGNAFKVFDLDFGRVGILQCYDGYFPEAWAGTAYAGAEIILWINGRNGMIEDYYCMAASHAHGCIVAANISNGKNTGFAAPTAACLRAEGEREEARLFPRIKDPGDACVHATLDMDVLRWHRKHLRTMHQRRPKLYHPITEEVRLWEDYPDIPWDYPECEELVNKSQL